MPMFHSYPWLARAYHALLEYQEAAMPLVTLTIRKPKSKAFKSSVLDAVHDSLVATGVPVADKFQRVIEPDVMISATTPPTPT